MALLAIADSITPRCAHRFRHLIEGGLIYLRAWASFGTAE